MSRICVERLELLWGRSLSLQDLRGEAPASLEERFTADCSFFYSKCKYTLGIFSWDSFFMLHVDSLNLQDLRGEASGSLEARFTAGLQ